MLAKLLCTKRKSASAPRCLRCLGATIDIVNSITRTANRSGQGGIFASMFTKGQHRGHGDHWAWRLTGNYCTAVRNALGSSLYVAAAPRRETPRADRPGHG